MNSECTQKVDKQCCSRSVEQPMMQLKSQSEPQSVIHNVPSKDFSNNNISLKNNCNSLLNSALCLNSSRAYARVSTHSSPPSSSNIKEKKQKRKAGLGERKYSIGRKSAGVPACGEDPADGTIVGKAIASK